MTERLSHRIVYGTAIGFLIAFSISIALEAYWVLAIPLAFAVIGLAFFSLDKLMLFIVLVTPLSITLTDKQFNVGLSLPTEPLLFGVLCMVVFKWLYESTIDNKLLKHPIVWALGFYLTWMLITSITSEMPLVSIKYFIARLWFVIPYFYVMIYVFQKDQKNINRFFWLFMISLATVAIYTIAVHSQYGFSKSTSTWVMFPFFKEHTSWGAVLAMYFPVSIYFVTRKGDLGIRAIAVIILGILTAAIILSYTRAAWVSLLGAGLVYIVMKLRIKFSYLLILGIISGSILYTSLDQFSGSVQSNKQDSSDKLDEHVQSISNVSTDASNLERINRWNSAMRLYKERPILGWGPGTYMFVYAPFQKPNEKTIISTNAGNRGNAHSEYLGPLAESGLIGMLSVMLLVFTIIYIGVRTYHNVDDKELKAFTMVSLLGLITYFTHGFLNNFLDMDKASAPVWGFTAVIVVINILSKNK